MSIIVPLVVLGCFNLIVVSSLNPNLLGKQILLWILGLISFWFGHHLNSNIHSKTQWLLFFLSCFVLIIPLVFSPITRGSKRWLNLGVTRIQPSEIVKPTLMLFLANTSLPLLHLLPIFLVGLQPDLGSAITLLSLLIPVIILNTKLLKTTIVAIAAAAILSPFIWKYTLHDYQRNRLITFVNPAQDPLGKGYHTIQSKIAIGSAGFFGKGYKKGSQGQLLFLPEKHTDFIFAATIEELGLLSGIIIILAYYTLIKGLILKASTSNSQPQAIFTLGIGLLIWTQVFVNIGMNIGLLPITGIPLPFLSVGGSSLVSLMFSLGIVFSS